MSYMRTVKVYVSKDHDLFDYAEKVTSLANNLSNAARFRQRQVISATSKPESEWTENEQQVMDEIRKTIPRMEKPSPMPTKGKHFLSYTFLDAIMKYTDNPDYYADGLARQSAQHILKQAVEDMKSFYQAWREYKKNEKAFTGAPKLPGYKRKGGHTTVIVTNQDCTVKLRDGKWYAGLPFAKKTPLCIGRPISNAELAQVTISPENGRYCLGFTFKVDAVLPEMKQEIKRICAIDFGLDNLMAVTNNCGIPSLLYKGGIAKSVNQKYNKQIAAIVSEQTLRTGKKFVPDEVYYDVTNRRNDQIYDLMHKCAKHLITWCVENRIDTVVMGVNKLWKQRINIGVKQNQEFVQLPFSALRGFIKYLCEWNGIRCVEQEESYTSKASFPDQDFIPMYGKEPEDFSFSGKRNPVRYKGSYKKDGFRGLYTTKNGTIINSDLNGSANILRKAYPDAFCEHMPDFEHVCIIRHPDAEKTKENRQEQKEQKRTSRLKVKRQRRKERVAA